MRAKRTGPDIAADQAVLQVAVPSPLRRLFDYLPPANGPTPRPGMRVQVPFGHRQQVGMVIRGQPDSELPAEKLKRISRCLDSEPVFDTALLQLLEFAGSYFHHPPGEVMACMLPPGLRRSGALRRRTHFCWRLTAAGRCLAPGDLPRAPRQREVLEQLQRAAQPLERAALKADAGVLRRLQHKELIEAVEVAAMEAPAEAPAVDPRPARSGPRLNSQQRGAVAAVREAFGRYQGFLLDGVTGSGKTEVYLELISECLERRQQVLILVPEIGLTPQLLARFQSRLGTAIATLHSGLSEGQRLDAWQAARSGAAGVVIGTRSAVFTPLPRLGLIIIDEEHDGSFKQQDGVRYSARDLAVVRASQADRPVVLGSATPSLESLHNVHRQAYRRLVLDQRAGISRAPRVEVIDLRGRPLTAGLSTPLEQALEDCLNGAGQALLFINRRGFAPVLLCHACGAPCDCPRCDAHLVLHQADGRLHCHHCQRVQPAPGRCECGMENSFVAVGTGTERVMEHLRQRFPQARLARVDRDSTRRRGALEDVLEAVHGHRIDILVGTQMLAKGHHFPEVTLVGILDVDGGLFSADFRAGERMAQLFVQVSGRAGRGERPGQVYLQTHHPQHPLLRTLIEGGYGSFAESALSERRQVGLPPFRFQALVRAEAKHREAAQQFLRAGSAACPQSPGLHIYGPVAAPRERRAGWMRAQLLLEAADRASLHQCLRQWLPRLETLREARRVRWSLDVDPLDMY